VRVIRCPNCQEPLPGIAKFCAKCGEHLSTSTHSLNMVDEDLVAPTIKIGHRTGALKVTRFNALNTGSSISTQHASSRITSTIQRPRRHDLVSSSQTLPATQLRLSEQDVIDDELQHRANWEKFVTHKTSRVTPVQMTPPAVPVVYKPLVGETPPALISIRTPPPQKATSPINTFFFLDQYFSFVRPIIRRRFWSCSLLLRSWVLVPGFLFKPYLRIESHSIECCYWWNYYTAWHCI